MRRSRAVTSGAYFAEYYAAELRRMRAEIIAAIDSTFVDEDEATPQHQQLSLVLEVRGNAFPLKFPQGRNPCSSSISGFLPANFWQSIKSNPSAILQQNSAP